MLRRAATALTATVVALALAPVAGAATSPAARPTAEAVGRDDTPRATSTHGTMGPSATSTDVVNAVVVQSYDKCESDHVLWQAINDRWHDYGTTELNIDYSYRPLCAKEVTYDSLIASGADVVILSNVIGGRRRLSKSEEDALSRYMADGHGLFATYLLLHDSNHKNRALSPVVGVHAKIWSSPLDVPMMYTILEPDSPLFRRMNDSYFSSGHPYSQVPRDLSWDENDLTDTARFVAATPRNGAAIIVNEATGYRSVYITTMPEYHGSAVDEQFIYNALTYVAPTFDAPAAGTVSTR